PQHGRPRLVDEPRLDRGGGPTRRRIRASAASLHPTSHVGGTQGQTTPALAWRAGRAGDQGPARVVPHQAWVPAPNRGLREGRRWIVFEVARGRDRRRRWRIGLR